MSFVRFVAVSVACSLSLAAVLVTAAPGRAGGSVTWQFPGCTPAPETLQECIDQAIPGDTVEIVTDTFINEFAAIIKSVDLVAGPGSHPSLLGVFVFDDGADPSPAVDLTVRGLVMTSGAGVRFLDGSGHRVRFQDVTAGVGPSAAGMSIVAGAPSSVTVIDSEFLNMDSEGEAIGLTAELASGSATFRFVGNRISGHGNDQSGGGIDLNTENASGSIRLDVFNNTFWDVARCNCGISSGLVLDITDSPDVDVNVVGNTFERSRGSLFTINNEVTGGGSVAVDVFGNIFAHANAAGISLDSDVPSTMTFRAGNNDYFANGQDFSLDGESAGTGNLTRDPRFVDRAAGNLRLKASSPLIDRGLVCSPGGIAQPDAAGRARLDGASVDMGAYERGAGPVSGTIFVGGAGSDHPLFTDGDDILCGYGGADLLEGGPGGDYLDGAGGPDVVIGGGGADRLFGGPKNDRLCAKDGSGTDELDGGAGTDRFTADGGDARVSVETREPCVV